jgi:transketolase
MNIDMRDAFFERLVEVAKRDQRVVFLTADHGAFALKEFEETMPDRYINIGISEQSMVGVAAGLAASGKIVFAYGISPFVSLRVMEQLTLDVAAMQLPVNIVSVGGGFTYSTDGPTHHGLQDLPAVLTIPNLTVLNSSDPFNTKAFVDLVVSSEKPHYIRIEKEKLPYLERGNNNELDASKGFSVLKEGDGSVLLISTGSLTHCVLESVLYLESQLGISISLIDLYRIKPIPEGLLLNIKKYSQIISLEEGYLSGMSQYLLGQICGTSCLGNFHGIGLTDDFVYQSDSRSNLLKGCGLDTNTISAKISEAINKKSYQIIELPEFTLNVFY